MHVDTGDLAAAAALVRRALVAGAGDGRRLAAGAHDTHAARLDSALDVFGDCAEAAVGVLVTRLGLAAGGLDAAAVAITALEWALARAVG